VEKQDTEQLKKVNLHLARTMRKRVKESSNSTIKIHRDKEFSENPMERVDLEETITVEEDGIKDLEAVYSYCREKCAVDLQVVRIPIVEDRMPPDYSFDWIISTLKNEPVSTPCVFSCQMGKGRTTVGLITACLIKEIQITKELRKMAELKLITPETLQNLIYEKFERLPDYPKTAEEEDP
jgi:protein-tyrosine phosphatase